jgi:hypothetical protein
MSIDTQERALLSADAYKDRSHYVGITQEVEINGFHYAVLAVESNWRTGYQGVAYQRKDTGEVIIAHRGTESVRDGVTAS